MHKYRLLHIFFHSHWDIVKNEVVEMVRAYFVSRRMNPNLNNTLISLISKVKNPEKVTEF